MNPPDCYVFFGESSRVPPLFVTHGMQCDPTFAKLSFIALGSNYPVYGFQGIGLDGTIRPRDSIEQMAEDFLSVALRVQHKGPYLLAGFCAGGHIAMEMAHRLLAQGHEVSNLLLIDTPATADAGVLRDAIESAVTVARQRLEQSPYRETLRGGPETVEAFGCALKKYRPHPYSGQTHILANRKRVVRMMDPELGWRKLLPSKTPVFMIAPDHDSLPRACIRRVDTPGNS